MSEPIVTFNEETLKSDLRELDWPHYPGQFHEVRGVPEKGGTRWPIRSIPGASPRSSSGRQSSFAAAASRPMRSWPSTVSAGRPSGAGSTPSTQRSSLSGKGRPYDNAVDESTNRMLKAGFTCRESLPTLHELQVELNDYVHWRNHFRLHSKLGCESPVEFGNAGLSL